MLHFLSPEFYSSLVPNSSSWETQVEEEVEPHEVPPEIEHVKLQIEEHGDEEARMKNRKYRTLLLLRMSRGKYSSAPLHANILDSSTGYVLHFRHNRGKPPNRYNPDEEERKSKYPIANYVSTKGPSKLKTFTQTLSSRHIPRVLRRRYRSRVGTSDVRKTRSLKEK
ncbi:hypothetical protein AAG906_013121 [Vitis piasezkii]